MIVLLIIIIIIIIIDIDMLSLSLSVSWLPAPSSATASPSRGRSEFTGCVAIDKTLHFDRERHTTAVTLAQEKHRHIYHAPRARSKDLDILEFDPS